MKLTDQLSKKQSELTTIEDWLREHPNAEQAEASEMRSRRAALQQEITDLDDEIISQD